MALLSDSRKRPSAIRLIASLVALGTFCLSPPCTSAGDAGSDLAGDLADVLFTRGTLFDGLGGEPFEAEIGVKNGRIVFVGNAGTVGFEAAETIDVKGLWVAPGFIDAHSHAELDEDYGRDGHPYLYQGITTVVLGIDGGGDNRIGDRFQAWREVGIGLNAMLYVGHGAARREVMGSDARAPTPEELEAMKDYVRQGMEEGALGLSTGLFYVPGTYAITEEVIEIARVAAEWEGAIYDSRSGPVC